MENRTLAKTERVSGESRSAAIHTPPRCIGCFKLFRMAPATYDCSVEASPVGTDIRSKTRLWQQVRPVAAFSSP